MPSGRDPGTVTTDEAGRTVVLLMDGTYPSRDQVPDQFTHRFTSTLSPVDSQSLVSRLYGSTTERTGEVTLGDGEPVTLAPPLAGDEWLVANGCCAASPHRRTLLAVDGRDTRFERFAVDWFGVDPALDPATGRDRWQPHAPGHRRRLLRRRTAPWPTRRRRLAGPTPSPLRWNVVTSPIPPPTTDRSDRWPPDERAPPTVMHRSVVRSRWPCTMVRDGRCPVSRHAALLGRDHEVANVAALLRRRRPLGDGHRAGGRRQDPARHRGRKTGGQPNCTGGAVFVDLAGIARADEVASAIAGRLEVGQSGNDESAVALRRALAQRELLLVLDNFEQVLAAAHVPAGLVEGCPDLRVLVTSRAPLRVRAERVFRLAALPVPIRSADSDVAEARQYASVELFCERATGRSTSSPCRQTPSRRASAGRRGPERGDRRRGPRASSP